MCYVATYDGYFACKNVYVNWFLSYLEINFLSDWYDGEKSTLNEKRIFNIFLYHILLINNFLAFYFKSYAKMFSNINYQLIYALCLKLF